MKALRKLHQKKQYQLSRVEGDKLYKFIKYLEDKEQSKLKQKQERKRYQTLHPVPKKNRKIRFQEIRAPGTGCLHKKKTKSIQGLLQKDPAIRQSDHRPFPRV